jgi:hypothetical protein
MSWILISLAMGLSQTVPESARVVWSLEFDRANDERGVEFGGDIATHQATAQGLVMDTVGSDPITYLPEFRIPTSPYQALEIVYECSRAGQGEIFYAHDRNTEYNGFSGAKQINVSFARTDGPTTMTLWPFWLQAPELIQLRLDPPAGVRFVLHAIRIAEVPVPPQAGWNESGQGALWPLAGARIEDGRLVAEGGPALLASPPAAANAEARPWLSLDWPADAAPVALQAGIVSPGSGEADWRPLTVEPGGSSNLWLPGASQLHEPGALLIVRAAQNLAPGAVLPVETVRLSAEPSGKPRPTVVYLGSQHPMPRVGAEEAVLLRLANVSSAPVRRLSAYLERPEGLEIIGASRRQDTGRVLVHGDVCDLLWPVRASEPGLYPITVRLLGPGVNQRLEATIEITASPTGLAPGRVPTPQPLATDYEIGVYYFPGWHSYRAWEVLDLFPERTPVLGYYREGMPEIVDWQILWAAERGVRFFAYDWYWDRGTQSLDHAIKAYLECEHREYLDFCLLWANHNGPGSHSREDLLAVTQFWIDNYFQEPGYYTVDGRPVVIIFNPSGIWSDMGGPEPVAEAFQAMRDLCESQGVPPVYLVACSPPVTTWHDQFEASGYDALSAYNWPGLGTDGLRDVPFRDLLAPHAEAWRDMDEASDLPIMTPISGGWDSRPWHGDGALVRSDRKPEFFEQHLRDAKDFMDRQDGPLARVAIVEAWNEWGEGSYVGPHREYGFEYLDAIARVFGRDPGGARIVLPKDVGLGPYDLPAPVITTEWLMDGPDGGWTPSGGFGDVSWEDGRLSFVALGSDPILQGPSVRFAAEEYPVLRIVMSSDRDGSAQMFWRTVVEPVSEPNSYSFDLVGDGELREYVLPLSDKPTWSGLVRGLRFDPTGTPGAHIVIDSIRFTTE